MVFGCSATPIVSRAKVPQQTNTDDCGAYALAFAKMVVETGRLDSGTWDDMPTEYANGVRCGVCRWLLGSLHETANKVARTYNDVNGRPTSAVQAAEEWKQRTATSAEEDGTFEDDGGDADMQDTGQDDGGDADMQRTAKKRNLLVPSWKKNPTEEEEKKSNLRSRPDNLRSRPTPNPRFQ